MRRAIGRIVRCLTSWRRYFLSITRNNHDGDFNFRMRFKVHDEVLWLLDTASRGEAGEPILRIENVIVKLEDAGIVDPDAK